MRAVRSQALIPLALAFSATASVNAGGAFAADMSITVEIPRLNVAEYHRPYVAVWLEGQSQSAVTNLAVWYDLELKNNEGTKWLKDMRQWWRRSGRSLDMPVDGLSSATRAPGTHTVDTAAQAAALGALPAGEYSLVVEAAREVGGRELLRVPFHWPPVDAGRHEIRGEHELGVVVLELKP